MSLDIWFAFIAAATVILVIPGPTIILVISHAVAHGRRAVLPLVAGVTLGDLTAMACSLMGLGAVLSVSATLFSILKWIGAGYLIYLGVKLWRSHPERLTAGCIPPERSRRQLFRDAFTVTALNPKSIAFFVAFLPQFVRVGNDPLAQFLILGATFLILAAVNAALYALLAGQLRDTIRNAGVRRWFDRCGGTALIGAGLVTATLQRHS